MSAAAIVALAGGGLPAAAAAVPLYFPGQVSVTVFGQASAVAAWDAENDGRSEVIVGSQTGLLALVRDAGRGHWVAGDQFVLGGLIQALKVGEAVPGQGTGLLVLTRDPDRLVLLSLSTAVPTFAIVAEVPLEEDPGDLALGPLGLDGGPGIAVTLPGIDRWVLLEPGAGGWRQTAEVPAGDEPERIVAVDLDGDGGPELITADRGLLSRDLSVYARTAGAWQLRQQLPMPGAPSGLAVWDEDGDGRSELFVSQADSAVVSVLEAAGGMLAERSLLPLPQATDGLVVGETMAGRQGLLAWSAARGTVNFLRRDAQQWSFAETFYGGGEALGGVLLELNGDAARDLALANGRAGSLGFLFGNRDPSFRAYLAESLPLLPSAALARDENGDGHVDVLVACAGSRTIERLLGDGGGHLRRQPSPVTLETGLQGLVQLDADGDGLTDLATLAPVADRLRVLRRLPDGGYTTMAAIATGRGPVALAAADVDGDGHQDLVVGCQITVQATIAYGDGTGAFPDVRTLPLGLSRLMDLAVVDISGDGLPDLVISGGLTNMQTEVNLGDRIFGRVVQMIVPGGPASLAVGDLDGDGDQDVAVALADEPALGFLENRSTGSLRLVPERVSLASRPGKLTFGQVDLSGVGDLVVALPEQRSVGISLGLGNWLFSPPLLLTSALDPAAVLVRDLNEDGIPDLVTVDRSLGLALSMLNITPDPVPVTPATLTAEATGGALRLVVRTEASGWRLEGGGGAGWRTLAVAGAALHGQACPGGDRWDLVLTGSELREAGLVADAAGRWRFRLLDATGGELAEATAALAVEAGRPPAAFAVGPARPNPFNPLVSVTVRLERAASLEAVVWDLAGRRVATVATGWRAAGEHVLRWDGRRAGRPAPAGDYLLTIDVEGRRQSRRLTLLK